MPDLPVSPIPSRAQVAPAEVPGVNALLTLVAAVVFIAALFLAREVLIPVTLAVLLSFVLAPLVELLRCARLPRVAAVLVAVVVAIGIILALAGLIGDADRLAGRRFPTLPVHHREEDRDRPARHDRADVQAAEPARPRARPRGPARRPGPAGRPARRRQRAEAGAGGGAPAQPVADGAGRSATSPRC